MSGTWRWLNSPGSRRNAPAMPLLCRKLPLASNLHPLQCTSLNAAQSEPVPCSMNAASMLACTQGTQGIRLYAKLTFCSASRFGKLSARLPR